MDYRLPTAPPTRDQQIASWSDLEFHRSFLVDGLRNAAYRSALQQHMKSNSTVLDLGSGTGILSFMAAEAGASRVLGVDWSDLAEAATQAAQRNKLADRVDFLRKDLRTLKRLDHPFLSDPPDIIVHDLIGGLVWDEDMTAILAHVRETVAGENTVILPAKCNVWLTPITAPRRTEIEAFWSSRIEGFDFSDFRDLDNAANEPFVRHETAIHLDREDCFLCEPRRLFEVDYTKCGKAPSSSSQLRFKAARDGWLDAYLGFMVVDFGPGIDPINTRPSRPATNWGQFLIPAPSPRYVNAGNSIGIEMQPSRWSADWVFSEFT